MGKFTIEFEHTDHDRWNQCMRGMREVYGNQPAVKALHEANYFDATDLMALDTDLMALDEEEYVQLCPGLVTFAYLLNGEWHAKPWFTKHGAGSDLAGQIRRHAEQPVRRHAAHRSLLSRLIGEH